MNVFVVVVAYLAFAAAAAAVAPAEAESAADDEAARSVVCFSKQQVALLLLRRRGQGIDVQLLSPMVIVIVTFVVVPFLLAVFRGVVLLPLDVSMARTWVGQSIVAMSSRHWQSRVDRFVYGLVPWL